MNFKVALAGNPNSGKTTLFNRLTGSKQHVGNWPGVTIEKKEGSFQIEEHEITLVDLPGIYSMSVYSMEEIVARDFIMDEHPDLILNIVDGTNIERNLYLSLQLKELGIPMVIAVNMLDELKCKGITIDLKQLSALLDTPVVAISAKNGSGMAELIHELVHNTHSSVLDYDPATETILKQISVIREACQHDHVHDKFYAMKMLENDEAIVRDLRMSDAQLDELHALQKQFCDQRGQQEIDMAVADMRYSLIEAMMKQCVKKRESETSVSDRIDMIVTNKYLGIPVFFLILFLMFIVTFGPIGEGLKGWVEMLINDVLAENLLAALASMAVAPWALDLVNTVIGGVGSVLSFMPQIMLLFLFLSVLEDSGYMSRAAFLMDGMLRKIGLNGKAFIPMLMGFGCTVPAVMASRVLEHEQDRKMTILLIPFMSCGAKLPVYALFAGIFFPEHSGIAIFSMYVLGILVAVGCGFLLRHTVFKDNESTFILELPPYRIPSFQVTMIHMWQKAKGFLIKAGTIIFSMTVLLWVLTNFSFTLQPVTDPTSSILGTVGRLIAPLLIPLGFGHWQSAIALISGLIAKESVVSSMAVMYNVGNVSQLAGVLTRVFTPASAIAFMTFVLLYAPCVAAISAIHSEAGSWKYTLKSMGFQISVAYCVSFVVYHVVSLFI